MTATITHLRVAEAHRRPPPGALPMNVDAYLHSVMEAATSLLRNNLEVAGFHADGDAGAVALWVRDCPLVRRMALLGEAAYLRSGVDADGPYRDGVFYRCGVTVIWRERAPS